MPKMTLEIYCDKLPEDYRSFEEDMQSALSQLNPDYILMAADYVRDDSDVEQMFSQSLNSFEDDFLRGESRKKSDSASSAETDSLFNLRITKS